MYLILRHHYLTYLNWCCLKDELSEEEWEEQEVSLLVIGQIVRLYIINWLLRSISGFKLRLNHHYHCHYMYHHLPLYFTFCKFMGIHELAYANSHYVRFYSFMMKKDDEVSLLLQTSLISSTMNYQDAQIMLYHPN